MFLKVMNVVKRLKNLTTNSSMALTEVRKDICKKVIKIQAELLPLVEETNDQDTGRASKQIKGF